MRSKIRGLGSWPYELGQGKISVDLRVLWPKRADFRSDPLLAASWSGVAPISNGAFVTSFSQPKRQLLFHRRPHGQDLQIPF